MPNLILTRKCGHRTLLKAGEAVAEVTPLHVSQKGVIVKVNGQKIVLDKGDNYVVTVGPYAVSVYLNRVKDGQSVSLGFMAPREVEILREELV